MFFCILNYLFRYVREDYPEIQEILDRNKSLGKYDPSSYESMASLCSDYNQAVEKYLDKKVIFSSSCPGFLPVLSSF